MLVDIVQDITENFGESYFREKRLPIRNPKNTLRGSPMQDSLGSRFWLDTDQTGFNATDAALETYGEASSVLDYGITAV